jgi:hypothetical protein
MSLDLRNKLRTTDGKEIVTANALPEWCILCMAGAGDTASEIGGDQQFMVSKEGQGDATIEFNFIDQVYIAEGTGIVTDAKLGDYIDFEVFAPASTPTANPGGTGNCTQVPIGGGLYMIVPAAGNGDYDIGLGPEDTDAFLVPASNGDGFWDWDYAPTGRGTISPNAEQTGKYNLFPVGMHLSLFATKLPIQGHDVVVDFGIPNVRAKMIPPHWKWKVTLHSDTSGNTSKVCFFLKVGRARTFVNPVIT